MDSLFTGKRKYYQRGLKVEQKHTMEITKYIVDVGLKQNLQKVQEKTQEVYLSTYQPSFPQVKDSDIFFPKGASYYEENTSWYVIPEDIDEYQEVFDQDDQYCGKYWQDLTPTDI